MEADLIKYNDVNIHGAVPIVVSLFLVINKLYDLKIYE